MDLCQLGVLLVCQLLADALHDSLQLRCAPRQREVCLCPRDERQQGAPVFRRLRGRDVQLPPQQVDLPLEETRLSGEFFLFCVHFLLNPEQLVAVPSNGFFQVEFLHFETLDFVVESRLLRFHLAQHKHTFLLKSVLELFKILANFLFLCRQVA
uniref:Putative secreted protein n=1 Tax=Ixodes ricinus TaxID=34613 RepID=A0A6B0UWH6_IXORI